MSRSPTRRSTTWCRASKWLGLETKEQEKDSRHGVEMTKDEEEKDDEATLVKAGDAAVLEDLAE